MPMMDLTYPEGSLTPEARAEVVERLTEALLRNEGAPVHRLTLGLSWVYVHELPEGGINIGGRPVVGPVYRLVVTVPKGTLLQGPGPVGVTSRQNLIREATEIILAGEGVEYSTEEALRVYVFINEVADGFWGGAGTMVRMEDIAAMAQPDFEKTPVAATIMEHVDSLLDRQLGPEEAPAEPVPAEA